MENEVKLTKLANCAGCGAKVGAGVLAQLLEGIRVREDPNLLVGFDKSDDAKEKVNAGAEVLLSQLFFDNEMFFRFLEDCRIAEVHVPVIPGIIPVINASQIKRMVTTCGATVPERFRKIIDKYENNREALFDAGMAYALSQIIDLLVSDIEGIHLYTMNNPLVARKICEGIRNII